MLKPSNGAKDWLIRDNSNGTFTDDERRQQQSNEGNHIHLNAGIRLASSCILPANTVPHGGQIIVHSTSQHSTTWRSDHRAFHQSTQYHMAVRSSDIPPVNTVPHGGQIIGHSTCQHSTTWWSDHHTVHQPTQWATTWRSNHHTVHQLSLIHISEPTRPN